VPYSERQINVHLMDPKSNQVVITTAESHVSQRHFRRGISWQNPTSMGHENRDEKERKVRASQRGEEDNATDNVEIELGEPTT
jgi:hypothetical protein